MIELDSWLGEFGGRLTELFGERIVFFGIQGSYARGEAGKNSDIDVVVILDRVEVHDLVEYREMLDSFKEREQICGFVSGVDELANWEKGDLFQLYYDTTPIMGNLDFLKIEREDAERALLMGACNLYHSSSHNFLHGREPKVLENQYKAALFVLRAKHYCEMGEFLRTRAELLERLTGEDREILMVSQKVDFPAEFDAYSAKLIEWTGKMIRK